MERLDPTTLAIGAAIGGGVGTLAAVVIVALMVRFGYRLFRDFDQLRTDALTELRAENAHLRELLDESSTEAYKLRRTLREHIGEEPQQ